MIDILNNPKTDNYIRLKNTVLGNTLPWFFFKNSVLNNSSLENEEYYNAEFYTHCVLKRPNDKILYSEPSSETLLFVNEVLNEIFVFNNILVNCIFRISFNCMYHTSNKRTIPHLDHDFPHKNLLIYLNDFDAGDTIVFGKNKKEYRHNPQEDDIITFDGNVHCNNHPSPGQRRVVLVTTYI